MIEIYFEFQYICIYSKIQVLPRVRCKIASIKEKDWYKIKILITKWTGLEMCDYKPQEKPVDLSDQQIRQPVQIL